MTYHNHTNKRKTIKMGKCEITLEPMQCCKVHKVMIGKLEGTCLEYFNVRFER